MVNQATPVLRRGQLSRLLQIVLALQSDRRPNARALAESCEVSRRTIFRDLDAIELAGITVEYDPARQGYRIGGAARMAPSPLEEREALALLVLANQWGGSDALGLVRQARSGVVKLIQGMPDALRVRLEHAAQAVRDGPALVDRPLARQALHDQILDALVRGVHVRLTCRGPAASGPESTLVAPYRLLLGRSGWCLIGRSSLHRRVRLLPLIDILDATLTDDPAVVPPRFDAGRWLANTWTGEPGPGNHEIRLRFETDAATRILDGDWHPSQRFYARADGRLDLLLTLDRLEDLVPWIMGHGDRVEVIDPAALRLAVREAALRVARRHGERLRATRSLSIRPEADTRAGFGRGGWLTGRDPALE